MINSRSLDDLLPAARSRMISFIADYELQSECKLLITSTVRDIEAQNALYARGRTKQTDGSWLIEHPERIVTKAHDDQSYHYWKLAMDAYPLIHGKPLLVVDRDNDKQVDPEWQLYVSLAKLHGLTSLAPWEYPHVQYNDGLTIAELRQGLRPT